MLLTMRVCVDILSTSPINKGKTMTNLLLTWSTVHNSYGITDGQRWLKVYPFPNGMNADELVENAEIFARSRGRKLIVDEELD